MQDFDTPKGRDVLKETPDKPNKTSQGVKQGRIIAYMPKNEELALREEAKGLGISAAGLIRFKLKKLAKIEGHVQ